MRMGVLIVQGLQCFFTISVPVELITKLLPPVNALNLDLTTDLNHSLKTL